MPFVQKAAKAAIAGLCSSFYVAENRTDNQGLLSRAGFLVGSELPTGSDIGVPVPVNIETFERRLVAMKKAYVKPSIMALGLLRSVTKCVYSGQIPS
jgi:hypothetical protein